MQMFVLDSWGSSVWKCLRLHLHQFAKVTSNLLLFYTIGSFAPPTRNANCFPNCSLRSCIKAPCVFNRFILEHCKHWGSFFGTGTRMRVQCSCFSLHSPNFFSLLCKQWIVMVNCYRSDKIECFCVVRHCHDHNAHARHYVLCLHVI